MKIKKDRNFYIALSISVFLLFAVAYNVYSQRREYLVAEERPEVGEMFSAAEFPTAGKETMMEKSDFQSEEAETVTVYVSGAVRQPRVLTLENGKRLVDAVELCGGLTEDADLNRTNLALKLKEEGHYVIPRIGEAVSAEVNPALISSEKLQSEQNLLDLNTATSEQLQSLPGIGEVLAERILQRRAEVGGFQTVEDLLSVSGIGEKKFNDIREKVRVD